MYDTTYHRDGTVTVWDSYEQSWRRLSAISAFGDDRLMSTLNAHERARIEARANGSTLASQRRIARALYRAASEGGAIQAHQMLRLTSDPRLHTAMRLEAAVDALGVRYAAALEGLEIGE